MYCERIERFIKSLGYKVEYVNMVREFGKEEFWTMGGIDYDLKIVFINERLYTNTKKMWLTMLHEAGHALGKEKFEETGELAAMEYGWQIAQALDINLSQSTWKEFNWEARPDDVDEEEASDKNHVSSMPKELETA